MAFQMSTLSARIRLITSGGPLSRSRGDFSSDSVGFSVKLRNIFSATQPKRQVHSLFRTGIAERVDNFSTTTVSKSFKGQNYGRACRDKSGTVYRIAIGAFGVTTAVACLHASAQVAMAEAHLNLDSVKSNWNKVKGEFKSFHEWTNQSIRMVTKLHDVFPCNPKQFSLTRKLCRVISYNTLL